MLFFVHFSHILLLINLVGAYFAQKYTNRQQTNSILDPKYWNQDNRSVFLFVFPVDVEFSEDCKKLRVHQIFWYYPGFFLWNITFSFWYLLVCYLYHSSLYSTKDNDDKTMIYLLLATVKYTQMHCYIYQAAQCIHTHTQCMHACIFVYVANMLLHVIFWKCYCSEWVSGWQLYCLLFSKMQFFTQFSLFRIGKVKYCNWIEKINPYTTAYCFEHGGVEHYLRHFFTVTDQTQVPIELKTLQSFHIVETKSG